MLEPGQLRDRGRGSRPQLGRHRYDIPVSWDGKWSGKADITPNGEQQPSTAQLNLKQDGATVTGTAGPEAIVETAPAGIPA